MRDKDQYFLVAIGGNLQSAAGVPAQTIRASVALLAEKGARVKDLSRLYRTPCFPPGAGPDYVNAAARISFDGSPEQMLALLHDVEAAFGRARDQRWGRRTLDLDLLAAGDAVLPDARTHDRWRDLPLDTQMTEAPEELILPHPRLHERAFVLVPLADVAPDWRHPVLGRTVREMCEALDPADLAEVRALHL